MILRESLTPKERCRQVELINSSSTDDPKVKVYSYREYNYCIEKEIGRWDVTMLSEEYVILYLTLIAMGLVILGWIITKILRRIFKSNSN